MMFRELISNQILVASVISWFLAQSLKVPIEYLYTKKWNWALWFSAGGMPSSHSSAVSAASLSIGLNMGFDSPLFALSFVIAIVIVYDATGIRRQAGLQAHKINYMINELLSGHPISEKELKELIGHTPRQAITGVLLGCAIALIVWLLWAK